MPAVQLDRLRNQLTDLAWKFTQPQVFQAGLIDLMESYADRVYRPGQSLDATQLLPRYHLPPLFRRELELMLQRQCAENPMAGLSLSDLLWENPLQEPRQVAAFLLGISPLQLEDEIIQRLTAWAQPAEDGGILSALFELGGKQIRAERSNRWLDILRGWLQHNEVAWQQLGLNALRVTADDRNFSNLPAVFNLLVPFLNKPGAALQGQLETILVVLQNRSGVETASVLRQVLILSGTERLERIIRSLLPGFPPQQQVSLRALLKNRSAG